MPYMNEHAKVFQQRQKFSSTPGEVYRTRLATGCQTPSVLHTRVQHKRRPPRTSSAPPLQQQNKGQRERRRGTSYSTIYGDVIASTSQDMLPIPVPVPELACSSACRCCLKVMCCVTSLFIVTRKKLDRE